LLGAYEVYQQCILSLENNYSYKINVLCEPQLGKRGLYPTTSQKGTYDAVKVMIDFIAYADGSNDLIDISNIIGVPVNELLTVIEKLEKVDLLTRCD
jgi:aminopeptidase-like protein